MAFIGKIEQKERAPGLGERLAGATQQIAPMLGAGVDKYRQKTAVEEFANQFEKNNPGSPMHKMIADVFRSPMDMEDKQTIVKALTQLDPFKAAQQERLLKDSVAARYTRRIKEMDTELDKLPPSKRGPLESHKKQLQEERDQLLGFEPLAEQPQKSIPPEQPKKTKKTKKTKFDPKNPEHKAKYQQVNKQFKGDKAKIDEALSREFE